jgi:ribose 1,5-bisphosphokinase PhnN
MVFTPKLIVVVGSPKSGKDLLIRAVNDLGVQHAQIVPKHTSRSRRFDDGTEMICAGDPGHNFSACDLLYENFEDTYGIECSRVWDGLRRGVFQVAVVSNIDAINHLKERFGELLVLVYVHSEMGADEYLMSEATSDDYVRRRVERYQAAFDLYLRNYLAFEHVLIYSGVKEDLFDQIFRLFRAYERSELY